MPKTTVEFIPLSHIRVRVYATCHCDAKYVVTDPIAINTFMLCGFFVQSVGVTCGTCGTVEAIVNTVETLFNKDVPYF